MKPGPRSHKVRKAIVAMAVVGAAGMSTPTVHFIASRQGDFNGPFQPILTGKMDGRYVIVAGDSFAGGAGARLFDPSSTSIFGHACFQSDEAGGVLAAKDDDLSSQNIACDGAGNGTFVKDQLPQIAKLFKEHGKPVAIILSLGGNNSGIDFTTRAEDAVFSSNYRVSSDSTFVQAKNLLVQQIVDDIDKITRITGGAPIILQGLPLIFGRKPQQDLLSGLLSVAEQQDFTKAAIEVNQSLQNAVAQRPGEATYVDITHLIRGVHAQNSDVVPLHWSDLYLQSLDVALGLSGGDFGLSENTNFHPLHPNESGNRELGDCFAPLIKKIVEAGPPMSFEC